jgi:hypothetical protein
MPVELAIGIKLFQFVQLIARQRVIVGNAVRFDIAVDSRRDLRDRRGPKSSGRPAERTTTDLNVTAPRDRPV